MRNKGKDLLQSYLDDALEFDDFENHGHKPITSNGVKKDSLLGQNLNIQVFKIHFYDVEKNSYIWGMNGKILAAGSMKNAWEVLDEISETYRQGNPKHIYLHFPKKVFATANMVSENGYSHIMSLTSADIAGFDKSLAHFKIFSIADEASAS